MARFGRYLLLEQLGQGGSSEVHLARRDGSERPCVLKLLRGDRVSAHSLSRLKREAHLLSYLDHPHIARILDAGVEEGVFYLALEHIDGHTLRNIMRKFEGSGSHVPVGAALSIVLSVLEGLAYAHDLKGPDGEALAIVHRDLSPSNIMVSSGGQVKIIDFGLASAKVDRFRTTPGVILGTFRYSAPEQVETGSVDRRSDLYTVAALLYEAVTGIPVVSTRLPKDVLQAVLTANPKPFREVAADLPDALWDVVRAGLSKDPKDRPQHARAFADRLRAAAHELPVHTPQQLAQAVTAAFASDAETPAWIADPDTVTGESTASATRELPPERKPTDRRMPWIVAAAAVAFIMLLSFGVVQGLISAGDPVVIPTRDRSALQIRQLLEEGRYREAATAMSERADRLQIRDALEIERMIYDALGSGDMKALEKILAQQLEMEAQGRR